MPPAENIAAISSFAKTHNLAFHIDGARIFNATVELGVDPAEYISDASSIMFCLSKSLCCPFGSLIVGDADFIDEARRWRLTFGGTLRQAGIMAAAGIVALDSMIDRLKEDHVNARYLAERLLDEGLAKLDLETVQTNMIRGSFRPICENAADLSDYLAREKIMVTIADNGGMRLVTHYWISKDDVEKLLTTLRNYIRR